jgi:hypothetical protein
MEKWLQKNSSTNIFEVSTEEENKQLVEFTNNISFIFIGFLNVNRGFSRLTIFLNVLKI